MKRKGASHLIYFLSKRFKKPIKTKDPETLTKYKRLAYDPGFDRYESEDNFLKDKDKLRSWVNIDSNIKKYNNNDGTLYNKNNINDSISPDNMKSKDPVLPRLNNELSANKLNEKLYENFEIIAEDECYIFAYKPAGLLSRDDHLYNKKHKTNDKDNITFYDYFISYWNYKYPLFRYQPDMIHEIDRFASGICVFAKKWCAENHFKDLLGSNTDYVHGCGIKRCTLTVCKGVPYNDEGVIEGLLKRSRDKFKQLTIVNHRGRSKYTKHNEYNTVADNEEEGSEHDFGDFVRTEYKVIDVVNHGHFGECSLILFTTVTNKKQQIRVSAKVLGTPIIGDTLYDGPRYNGILMHQIYVGFTGIVGSNLMYAVSQMPRWSHLMNHFWSTKAQYNTKKYINKLKKNPIPEKKLREIYIIFRKYKDIE